MCLPAIPDLNGAVSVYSTPDYGDSTFCMVIDSIATVLYDTSYLKTVYTHSLSPFNGDIPPGVTLIANWSSGVQNAIGIYAKNIGGVRGGILPKTQYNSLVDEADPTGNVRLNCYHDNSRSIKITTGDCDFLPRSNVSINALSGYPAAISVYPNPCSVTLTLSVTKPLPEAMAVHMTDVTGRTLKTATFAKGANQWALDVRTLPSGIYFLKLHAGAAQFYQKVIVQH